MTTATTATATSAPATRPTRVPPPFARLPRRVRQSVLVVHVLSAGAWVGVDVVVAALVVAGRVADPATSALAYRALGTFVLWPMLGSALLCLATGLLLGLATKWGLVRYWWVLVKLVITLALTALIVLALRPALADAVAHGEQLAASGASGVDVSGLVFPPIVSLTALSVATVLSVFTPWGRLRRGRLSRRAGGRSSRRPTAAPPRA